MKDHRGQMNRDIWGDGKERVLVYKRQHIWRRAMLRIFINCLFTTAIALVTGCASTQLDALGEWTFYPIRDDSKGCVDDGVLCIENKGDGRGYFTSKPFPVRPGASYQFSVDVKAENATQKAVFAKIFWFQGPDCRFQSEHVSGNETIRIGGTQNWTTLPAIGGVKAPTDANVAVIRLESNSPPLSAPCTAIWDDVLLNAGEDFPDSFWTKWRGDYLTVIKDGKDKVSGGNSIKMLSNKHELCALNSNPIEFKSGNYQIRFYAKTDDESLKRLTPFNLFLNGKISVPVNSSSEWCEYTKNFNVETPSKGYFSLRSYLPVGKSLWVDKLRILRVPAKKRADKSLVSFKNIVFKRVE